MCMRRNLSPLYLMTALATVIPLSAHADSASVARKSIQAIYDRQDAAGSRLDSDGTLNGYAPNFVSIDGRGKRSNLTQERQTSRAVFATMKAYTGKTTIQKISVKGDVATVRVSEHDTSILTNPQTNQEVHVVYDATSVDIWKKSGKGWLLIRAKILSEHGTIDGHSAPG